MGGYSNRTWACPFFTWDERLCIHCEGGRVCFRDKPEAAEYTARYCASPKGWKDCTLACSLLKYYDRTERTT